MAAGLVLRNLRIEKGRRDAGAPRGRRRGAGATVASETALPGFPFFLFLFSCPLRPPPPPAPLFPPPPPPRTPPYSPAPGLFLRNLRIEKARRDAGAPRGRRRG